VADVTSCRRRSSITVVAVVGFVVGDVFVIDIVPPLSTVTSTNRADGNRQSHRRRLRVGGDIVFVADIHCINQGIEG